MLAWQGKDILTYRVANDNLVIRRNGEASDEWQIRMSCKVCFTPTVAIKLRKNPSTLQSDVVSRCPHDQLIFRTELSRTQKKQWKPYLLPQIFRCDLCEGPLVEKKQHTDSFINGSSRR